MSSLEAALQETYSSELPPKPSVEVIKADDTAADILARYKDKHVSEQK